jgi:Spy/CpxP family protein refolding chaperone
LNVQLPEGISDVGLSRDQQSQLQTVIHSRDQEMIALSRKAQAARIALEQAILSERFDEAAVNQRRDELIAILSEQLDVNTGILLEARKILTPNN